MKYLSILAILGLFACGGNESVQDNEDLSVESVAHEMEADQEAEESDTAIEEEFVPENSDGLWQIDDYAELMLKTKIYPSYDEVPDEKRGNCQIYDALDLKGGFANVTGPYEGWHEFVIWRMADGNDLLGTMSAGCGPVCSYDYDFHIMKNGAFVQKNAEETVFPWAEINEHKKYLHDKVLEKYPDIEYLDDAAMRFIFPQKGTSMTVHLIVGAEEIETKLLELSWDKSKFSITKKYETVDNTSIY